MLIEFREGLVQRLPVLTEFVGEGTSQWMGLLGGGTN